MEIIEKSVEDATVSIETTGPELARYSENQLTKYRAAIARLGTSVPNGTVSLSTDLTKKRIRIDLDTILKTPYSETKSWRIYSRIFYSNPLYKRLIEYLSSLYYNQYIISPLIVDGKKVNHKKLVNDYNAILRTLDEDIRVETLTSQILSDLLIEGESYYYLEEYNKSGNIYYKPIKLPTDYCKIIGTAGTPAINIMAVDVSFIDTLTTTLSAESILSTEEILAQYPKVIQKAYRDYRGKNKNATNLNKKWVVLSPENGMAFKTRDGRPPLCQLIKELARIDKFEKLRDDYIETNLSKILVQMIGVDKEGNPDVDLELAADFHKNLKEIASKKHNVDALTTLAKIEAIDLGKTGEQKDNYDFLEAYYKQFFTDSGTSAEIFNSTTSGTLDASQKKDEAFMRELRLQIETWLNYFLGTICNKKVAKNSKFVLSFLETSYKNREKMIGSYTAGASYGFSKIVPQVALGVKQRYIDSLISFENDVLELDKKLVPLQSSNTMSSNSNSETDSTNGRPALTDENKDDSTLAKEVSK